MGAGHHDREIAGFQDQLADQFAVLVEDLVGHIVGIAIDDAAVHAVELLPIEAE